METSPRNEDQAQIIPTGRAGDGRRRRRDDRSGSTAPITARTVRHHCGRAEFWRARAERHRSATLHRAPRPD